MLGCLGFWMPMRWAPAHLLALNPLGVTTAKFVGMGEGCVSFAFPNGKADLRMHGTAYCLLLLFFLTPSE